VSYLASLCTLPFIRARMQASRREPAAPAPSQRQPVPSQRQPVPSQRQPDLSQRQPDLSQRQPDPSQRQPDPSQREPDPPTASAPGAPRGLRAELGEGLAWTWRQPFLRYSAFFAAAVNILLQVLTLGLIVLARHDGASSAQIGIIVGCMGAGGLVGAFVAPRVQRKVPAGAAITSCMWIWAILLALIVLVRVPLWLCPIVAVFGFVGPSWNVSVQTYRMQITPNELLGRTSSVAVQIGWGVIPLGSLLAGFLLEALSPSAAMTAVAAGMAVTAVVATALAPVRDAGRRTPGASGSAGAAGAAPAAG
jgi:hypothetical protein